MTNAKLTHLAKDGSASMVDVSAKGDTMREATARGHIRMREKSLALVCQGNMKKGDVIGTARIAGIMAAKQTSGLIPLCHPLILTKIRVDIEEDHALPGLRVMSTVRLFGKTGVEMEALTACSVACLTIYDMVKAVDREMEIGGIQLVKKIGGKSGNWDADNQISDQNGAK